VIIFGLAVICKELYFRLVMFECVYKRVWVNRRMGVGIRGRGGKRRGGWWVRWVRELAGALGGEESRERATKAEEESAGRSEVES
jgi:hypothetical protein